MIVFGTNILWLDYVSCALTTTGFIIPTYEDVFKHVCALVHVCMWSACTYVFHARGLGP